MARWQGQRLCHDVILAQAGIALPHSRAGIASAFAMTSSSRKRGSLCPIRALA